MDRNKSSYVGGILEMANARLYRFWGSLTDGLRTGNAQNEAKTGEDFFGTLYADPQRLEGFLKAMTGLSLGSARVIAKKFPWKQYRTLWMSGAHRAAWRWNSLWRTNTSPAGAWISQWCNRCSRPMPRRGVDSRLRFVPGDFFKESLPHADVIIMGHILHDWNLDDKMMLLRKAYAALPPKGALIVHEALIDDDRKTNAFGLLMSLNMLIETHGGFDFTGADCRKWMKEAGFSRNEGRGADRA